MKTPAPQFRPAFEIGDKVRVKPWADHHFGDMTGEVTETLPQDHYGVRFAGVLFSRQFARKELERA